MGDTRIKRFVLQIIERNEQNPLQAGPVNSVEGNDLVEILAKLPILILEIQARLEKKKSYIDDDIPF